MSISYEPPKHKPIKNILNRDKLDKEEIERWMLLEDENEEM